MYIHMNKTIAIEGMVRLCSLCPVVKHFKYISYNNRENSAGMKQQRKLNNILKILKSSKGLWCTIILPVYDTIII